MNKNQKPGIFQSFDHQLNGLVDKLVVNPNYQKFLDTFSGLDDNAKKVLSQVGHFSLIFLPLIIAFIVFLTNVSLKNKLTERKEIITLMDDFIDQKNEAQNVGRTIISPTNLSSKKAFESKLSSIGNSGAFTVANVTVMKFEQIKANSVMSEVEATINFKNFTVKELTELFKALQQRIKVKILSTNIAKNKKTKEIRGSIQILHIGRGVK